MTPAVVLCLVQLLSSRCEITTTEEAAGSRKEKKEKKQQLSKAQKRRFISRTGRIPTPTTLLPVVYVNVSSWILVTLRSSCCGTGFRGGNPDGES